jgi:hypothetical protein
MICFEHYKSFTELSTQAQVPQILANLLGAHEGANVEIRKLHDAETVESLSRDDKLALDPPTEVDITSRGINALNECRTASFHQFDWFIFSDFIQVSSRAATNRLAPGPISALEQLARQRGEIFPDSQYPPNN